MSTLLIMPTRGLSLFLVEAQSLQTQYPPGNFNWFLLSENLYYCYSREVLTIQFCLMFLPPVSSHAISACLNLQLANEIHFLDE